ncbi:hypothetical protein ACP0AK_08260 [Listeria ivanovii]|uniref:DUF4064 domain-containing protein n=1 Tax=Listeria ivanovii (strain ATCC BAA-678 / PAM 55) TaxID=881621 RepID=G2ZD76_LISIP|nr:hypothetical protein [Listeria ivanovii]AHI56578.1 membrane protein [Listeria ivanovii WSLC3009]AIS65997.1 membrane protein [Listeria ivanovii subsp. ivanovii]MBC1758964.1 hypothetical protein [Listeria ivanovii]MBK3913987.1 hypothetical protein [Listeria ivanovii subsp. ivanovii]MBK3921175.1 hypothetical protein [Listeria ivanovii subsp. ivanovii]
MNWTRISSIIIVGFTAIGAIYGGLSFIFTPSGDLLSLSTGLLEGSPFVDYLIPGIFLFVFVGLFHLAALIYLLKKLPRTKEVMFAAALVLAVWMIVQLFIIGYVFILQPIFLAIAIVEMILAVQIKKQQKKGINV